MKLMETLNQCINAGHEMTKAIAIAQFNDDSPEARKITRRWRIGEAADLVGVSSQAIRDAEKAGRLPHPDMEIRGRVEQRVGYTIEQINHMRDVFGTRLRRAEDVFPPVIGVAAHKGGVYKTSVSVHLAQDLALKGLRVLLVEGNDPQGTASMYHGWVPDLHIHAEDTLLPFYLGEKDDVTYAIKPTCWPGLDIIPSCLALHRIETELMGKFDEGKLPTDPHLMLRLAIETVAHDYDVIVIDSAPNLGIGTINVVCAADVLIVPTPAELFDYTSALQFFDMLRDLLKNVDLKGFEPDIMKRAPVIPKHTLNTQPVEDTSLSTPAAPMVDSLIARVGVMARGNAITLPVCGRDVKFTLEVLRGDSVEKTSRVWSGNERDQELLTEDALDDLIPSFLLTGQQTPAFGRRVSGVIEIADGSRRRKAAALTESDYRVLVGELDDEQMAALSRLGNDYRPTSAYERGQRYASRLQNEFAGNISALADAENISRKIITRCINTAKLPKSVVALFSHPGELSARSGDALQKAFTDKEELLKQQASNLHEQKKAGVIFEAEEVITLLTSVLKTSSASRTSLSSRHQFAPGATVLYKGDKMVLNLDRSRVPTECIEKIEAILKELEKPAP
nr:hypothetical protein FAC10E3_56 [Penicillium camemberti]